MLLTPDQARQRREELRQAWKKERLDSVVDNINSYLIAGVDTGRDIRIPLDTFRGCLDKDDESYNFIHKSLCNEHWDFRVEEDNLVVFRKPR